MLTLWIYGSSVLAYRTHHVAGCIVHNVLCSPHICIPRVPKYNTVVCDYTLLPHDCRRGGLRQRHLEDRHPSSRALQGSPAMVSGSSKAGGYTRRCGKLALKDYTIIISTGKRLSKRTHTNGYAKTLNLSLSHTRTMGRSGEPACHMKTDKHETK